jgi:phosphoribosylamine--glycine ligase
VEVILKALVIGEGGKEHAIVWKLSQSKHINKIYCCPGNAGISEIAECIDVDSDSFTTLTDFVKYEWIDFTIVCSRKLISKGIVNAFKREGCRIFGPDKNAAELIESRAFSKNLLKLYSIPAPEFKVFTSYLHAQDYIRLKGGPLIIKTDGIIPENGIFEALTVEGALELLKNIFQERLFGKGGEKIIIEEKLQGDKITFVALTDGKTVVPFTSLYKYINLFDGDTGPYTFGMGAFSPGPYLTKNTERIITEKILKPMLRAINTEGIKYRGIFSAELILSKGDPYLCDVNYCLNDLEAQTILPRLKTDLTEIIMAAIEEKLSNISIIEWIKEASVCIVVSSEGYPGKYRGNIVIKGIEKVKQIQDIFLFHNNTAFNNGDIVNTGGVVISLIALGKEIKDARTKAYDALENIHFEGMHYRRDIGV